MKLRETWAPNQYDVPACVWCKRPASRCVLETPCDGRISFEEELRVPHGVGCGCYWCQPVRPGISPPPSSEMVRRMDSGSYGSRGNT
jgi:hypothetical protein